MPKAILTFTYEIETPEPLTAEQRETILKEAEHSAKWVRDEGDMIGDALWSDEAEDYDGSLSDPVVTLVDA